MKALPKNPSMPEELAPFSGIDFIITDLDGTLTPYSDSVLEQIKKTIGDLRNSGVEMTISTGRTYSGIKKILEELDITVGMPIALYNGAVVIEYGTNRVLCSSCIKKEDVLELLETVDLKRTNLYLYGLQMADAIRATDIGVFISEKLYGLGIGEKVTDVNGMKINWINANLEGDLSVNTALIEKNNLSAVDVKRIIKTLERNDNLSYTDSGSGFIEIKRNGVDKGIIFEIISKQSRYRTNKILAVGDNDNDIALFHHADISVAVANASFSAKKKVDYICTNEYAEGFLEMLDVLKKQKNYKNRRKKHDDHKIHL